MRQKKSKMKKTDMPENMPQLQIACLCGFSSTELQKYTKDVRKLTIEKSF